MSLSSLHRAAYLGDTAALRELLQQGASVHERGSAGGWTALHVAAGNGHIGAVEALLAASAEPSASDGDGRSAVDWADWAGHSAVGLVLRRHARLNVLLEDEREAKVLEAQRGHDKLLCAEARIAELGKKLAAELGSPAGSQTKGAAGASHAWLEASVKRAESRADAEESSALELRVEISELRQRLKNSDALQEKGSAHDDAVRNAELVGQRCDELRAALDKEQARAAQEVHEVLCVRESLEEQRRDSGERVPARELQEARAVHAEELEKLKLCLKQEQHESERERVPAEELLQVRAAHAEELEKLTQCLRQEQQESSRAAEELRVRLSAETAEAKAERQSCEALREEATRAKEEARDAQVRAAAASRAWGR
eukprot:TRINITY_DN64186_c0_g1_i1.p1 TRINITY_DN64186_c0_g1~~TRINITY_DN64186_c0_g1_i1.p1  ORF type:complete len:372 (+),score=138.42 TRINITY_DN64186_c0_g1_i1:112-1227(+)